jgi:hypothetical protein
LQKVYKVEFTRKNWTLQDSSRRMQYQVRKGYRTLILDKKKRDMEEKIVQWGLFVKIINIVSRLKLPFLNDYDEKMQEFIDEPVTSYKLDELNQMSASLEPEDPKYYIMKHVAMPILIAVGVKVAMIILKPFINVEEVIKVIQATLLSRKKRTHENKSKKTNVSSQGKKSSAGSNGGGGNIMSVVSSFLNAFNEPSGSQQQDDNVDDDANDAHEDEAPENELETHHHTDDRKRQPSQNDVSERIVEKLPHTSNRKTQNLNFGEIPKRQEYNLSNYIKKE